jgi:hypothetical protein
MQGSSLILANLICEAAVICWSITAHADAGMASLDADYRLIAAVHKNRGKYRLSTTSLENYFIPKKDIKVTRELLLEKRKGIGYTKVATLYLFQKVR